MVQIQVSFARQDTLPGLPRLTASTDDGCQFCSLLISALRNRGLTERQSTERTLSVTQAQYEWHAELKKSEEEDDDPLDDGSLHLLSLRVEVGGNEPFK